jgi:hypothetical protein
MDWLNKTLDLQVNGQTLSIPYWLIGAIIFLLIVCFK